MIEDPELRALFQAECEERMLQIEHHIKKLEDGLSTPELWEELMRDVHTIKGSSRMLNIQSIEVLSHHFEDLLESIHQKKILLGEPVIELFYLIIDGLRSLLGEEVEGTARNFDIEKLFEQIHAVKTSGLKTEKIQIEQPADSKAASIQKRSSPLKTVTEEKLEIPPAKFKEIKGVHLSTLRVNIDQVNQLMNQVVELSVVRNHMEGLFELIEEVQDFCEERKKYKKNIYKNMTEAEALKKIDVVIEEKLGILRSDAYDHIHRLDLISSSLVDGVRKLGMVPISKLFDLFPGMVRELSKSSGKETDFVVENENIKVDRKIIEELKDPLMHILRNAISHGIELPAIRQKMGKPARGRIELLAKQTEQSVIIQVKDDGGGLNLERIKEKAVQSNLIKEEELSSMSEDEIFMLIFAPGFSTVQNVTEVSGRGVGLDVVQSMVESLHGNLSVKTVRGKETTISIELPINFVTTEVLLVHQDKRVYAIPIDRIDSCLLITLDQILSIEDEGIIYLDGQPYPVLFLRDLLGKEKKEEDSTEGRSPCLVIKSTDSSEKKIALIVDAILEEQKLVLVNPDKRYFQIKGLVGISILKNGEVCLALSPFDLIRSGEKHFRASKLAAKVHLDKKKKKTILIVDDSSTSRMILKQVLEGEGYKVVIAEDGLIALEKLNQFKFDAVVTDADMPKMSGFDLTSHIRTQYYDYLVPIIIFSSLSDAEHVKKGKDSGASAYIIKAEFNQVNLVKKLKELLE